MGAYHTMQDTTRCTEGNMVHNTFINVYDMGEGCAVNNLSAVSDIYLLLAISHSPYQESQHHNIVTSVKYQIAIHLLGYCI